ncbi:MAG: 1-deoxy-D-xylulose-5-phosphate reductoisomerase [Porphyromonadaceae bacterium]|nr:1-deoxy-D-xylulose-5-phosphate reductoisomerase [Porphyromonadaceae bacterium]
MNKKRIAILGSTGSIGTQALDVIRNNKETLEAYLITGRNNADLLIEQAREFHPEVVVVAQETNYLKVKEALKDLPIKVWCGAEAIAEAVTIDEIDIVLTAMVGYAGLVPTLSAIKSGKIIALANKETLVVAGELVIKEARKYNATIIPVDSEHSAIFQCLVGEFNPIEKILLTASGGPFLHTSKQDMAMITKEQALKHPNWTMGAKVTIDSATLMNKGFEMIEARWLFDCRPEQIQVVVHPESIIHSMVQFQDGSIKAQLGIPDMRLPISYALGLTKRISNDYPRVDFFGHKLTFFEPDTTRFPNLTFAYDAIAKGGNTPCVLNAANEVAVDAFLHDKLSFCDIPNLIEKTIDQMPYIINPKLQDFMNTDRESRAFATSLLRK